MGDEVATEALVGRARKASDLKTPALVALTDGVVGMLEYSLGRCESALTRFERSSTLVEYFGPTHPIVPATTVAHIEALWRMRSEEHTSELQSRGHLVCRRLLEKKKVREHKRHMTITL